MNNKDISEANKNHPFYTTFPKEVMNLILREVPLSDLNTAAITCRLFRDIIYAHYPSRFNHEPRCKVQVLSSLQSVKHFKNGVRLILHSQTEYTLAHPNGKQYPISTTGPFITQELVAQSNVLHPYQVPGFENIWLYFSQPLDEVDEEDQIPIHYLNFRVRDLPTLVIKENQLDHYPGSMIINSRPELPTYEPSSIYHSTDYSIVIDDRKHFQHQNFTEFHKAPARFIALDETSFVIKMDSLKERSAASLLVAYRYTGELQKAYLSNKQYVRIIANDATTLFLEHIHPASDETRFCRWNWTTGETQPITVRCNGLAVHFDGLNGQLLYETEDYYYPHITLETSAGRVCDYRYMDPNTMPRFHVANNGTVYNYHAGTFLERRITQAGKMTTEKKQPNDCLRKLTNKYTPYRPIVNTLAISPNQQLIAALVVAGKHENERIVCLYSAVTFKMVCDFMFKDHNTTTGVHYHERYHLSFERDGSIMVSAPNSKIQWTFFFEDTTDQGDDNKQNSVALMRL